MTFPLEPSPLLAIGTLLLAAALLFAGWFIRRGWSRTSGMRTGTPAIKVAGLAAAGCTAYSADTSWRFAADYLDMGSTVERAFMFATAELALFATALMARQNLNGPARAPGVPGVLVWVITGVQIIPAYAEFGLVGGTVRAFVGPVMAAMLWHLAMGIELRHRTPQAASRGLAAVLVRQTRERLLARLGIADQDADAARLIRERALSDAVALILRAETMTDGQRGTLRAGACPTACTRHWSGLTSTETRSRTSCCCASSPRASRPSTSPPHPAPSLARPSPERRRRLRAESSARRFSEAGEGDGQPARIRFGRRGHSPDSPPAIRPPGTRHPYPPECGPPGTPWTCEPGPESGRRTWG